MVAHIQTIAFSGVDALPVYVQVHYQARFQLVAAMNPCRCGHADDTELACHRLPTCRKEYLSRLSGPLLDRFDIRIDVPPVRLDKMIAGEAGEASAPIAARVLDARQRQIERQDCLNAQLDGDRLRALAKPDAAGQKILDHLIDDRHMTARGFNRILRVALTVADLAGRHGPGESDIATATIWRRLASVQATA